eukprot:CAMPEP_0197029838 /NCGR_PEP_ID=MMETSP1384-20130603/9203_1 /TAXON_ID=29189 /ORGANISM="Ammonia sp." /LENGTH=200 /DNA_ID=CAMNT_0042459077 /DNA_START=101 /DNA_END=703 /DNA_ORIENTATION=+
MSDTEDEENAIKIVCVGDGAIGKTSMLIAYRTNEFPTEYVPTIFENVTIEKTIQLDENKEATMYLDLWDTAGQEQFDRLRILAYKDNVHVFLLCFSLEDLTSFKNLETKWIPEIKQYAAHSTLILVGTKSDLQDQTNPLIDPKAIEEYRKKCGAAAYVETSAMQRKNVDLCFETAIRHFVQGSNGEHASKKNVDCSCLLL